MFQIKICGITSPVDALSAAHAGADVIGLNFYEKSLRWVPRKQVRRILSVLPASTAKVGVFVNAPVAEVIDLMEMHRLDYLQLHGDEPPEYLAEVGGRPVIRAMRLSAEGLSPILKYLAECDALGATPQAVLLDAYRPEQYGGTGATADWSACADYARRGNLPPLVLAGGLTPANVAEAIRTVHPAAVDTASGVESRPGHKDPEAMAAFVQAARQTFGKP